MASSDSERPTAWTVVGAQRAVRTTRPPRRRSLGWWLALVARVALVAVVLFVVASGFILWRLGSTVTDFAGAHFNLGENAVWLEHTWAGDEHSGAEYDALADRLEAEQIRFVYAHVGPLDSDGTIPDDRATYAKQLATALHQRMPNVRVLAWIGQVEIAGGFPADESVDLADSSVRERIAETAAHFARELGFDGVHYDIEPITNNNNHFLDLLDVTRSLLPAGAILSLTAQKWAPNAHVADWLRSKGKADAWWTTYYYTQVAAHCDQVVSILYDTAMPTAGLYQLYVKQAAQHILEAARAAPNGPQVLFGVPTYRGDSFWFHDTSENMKTGLEGVREGLNSERDTSLFTGIAVYRLGTTTDADWRAYDGAWLGN
jgi:hypothetical protein